MATLTPNRDTEVTVVEQGDLRIIGQVKSITGVAYYTESFTVPTGKKWVLKSSYSYSATGTYTVHDVTLKIYDGANSATLYAVTADRYNYNQPLDITLQEGWFVQIIINCTAHTTTGNYNSSILVQQSDA